MNLNGVEAPSFPSSSKRAKKEPDNAQEVLFEVEGFVLTAQQQGRLTVLTQRLSLRGTLPIVLFFSCAR
jgi:hypothetical protein